MLRVVFDMLDDGNRGCIGRAQVSEMTHSLTHSRTHALTHSPACSFSIMHFLSYLLTHSLTYSLTYLLTHSLTQISEMARSADIQDILKYTVFWLPLKRRQWSFFYSIFDDEGETVRVSEWLRAGEELASSECVCVRHLRLDEEHRGIADSCSATGDWSEAR
jgi:hypothetical protein